MGSFNNAVVFLILASATISFGIDHTRLSARVRTWEEEVARSKFAKYVYIL
jgi:hypothetical protein